MAAWIQITAEHARKLQPGTPFRQVDHFTGMHTDMMVIEHNGRHQMINEERIIQPIRKLRGKHYEIYM